jgi:hypothetical protein
MAYVMSAKRKKAINQKMSPEDLQIIIIACGLLVGVAIASIGVAILFVTGEVHKNPGNYL